MVYNIMTCSGWGETSFLGGCAMSWAGLVIVLFIIFVLRRQCDDGLLEGTGFNFPVSLSLGVLGYLITIVFVGEARWALIAGVAGTLIGGFLFSFFDIFGGGGD